MGSNALRTYDITTNNYFYLDVQTQTDGNKFAELVLEKPLDREQQAAHRYVLTAVDGGQPPRTGTALLVVKVLDSNDNVPVFDQPVYTVSLPENAPVGTLVLQLNATDLDEGLNGEIVYSFSNHISSRVKDLFSIDPRTGRIEVRTEVDFEESGLYQIFVQAKDLGPERRARALQSAGQSQRLERQRTGDHLQHRDRVGEREGGSRHRDRAAECHGPGRGGERSDQRGNPRGRPFQIKILLQELFHHLDGRAAEPGAGGVLLGHGGGAG